MAFTQYTLYRISDQSRGIFDTFGYKTDDSLATVKTSGYFNREKFGYYGPGSDYYIIYVMASDGFATVKMDLSDYSVTDVSGGSGDGVSESSFTLLDKSQSMKLSKLYASLYEGVTTSGDPAKSVVPTTNRWNTCVIGDSVGYAKPKYITENIRSIIGTAGGIYISASTANGASSVNDVQDGTYWINGSYFEIPSGGDITFTVSGGRPRCTQMRVFYITEDGGGTFKIQVNDGGGFVDDATYSNVDTDNATTSAGVATITKTQDTYSLKVVGLTGTVRLLFADWVNEDIGGVVEYNFTKGGLPLATCLETPEAVRDVVFNALGVDTFWTEFKDDIIEFTTTFPAWMAYRVATFPDSDYVWIGTSPGSSESTNGPETNAIVKAYADSRDDFVYFDGYSIYRDWATIDALGWGNDGTHLTEEANIFAANLLYKYLGLDTILDLPVGSQVVVNNGKPLIVRPGAKIVFQYAEVDYPEVEMTFDPDFNIKSGRSFIILDQNGDRVLKADTSGNGSSVDVAALGLVLSGSVGPVIRPLGSTQYSGGYMSDKQPGNGAATAPWLCSELRVGTKTDYIDWTKGDGTPEGSVTAGVGSLYSDVTNGDLYFKETGTGNTGWVLK